HEQHGAVGLQQGIDAGAHGGVEGHGERSLERADHGSAIVLMQPATRRCAARRWHHRPMDAPHRPPRRPRAWLPLLLASQALVAVAWWQCGWTVGLPLLLASHGL